MSCTTVVSAVRVTHAVSPATVSALNRAVRPLGEPVAAKFTGPAKAPSRVITRLTVSGVSGWSVTESASLVKENDPVAAAAWTVSDSVAVAASTPVPVPVMVTSAVPSGRRGGR